MAGIIERGSEKHNLHLSLIQKENKQVEYDAGFEIGKNRQQLEQGASADKKLGYMAGMSAGKNGSATSPQTAFSKPENEGKQEKKEVKIPERKTESETE